MGEIMFIEDLKQVFSMYVIAEMILLTVLKKGFWKVSKEMVWLMSDSKFDEVSEQPFKLHVLLDHVPFVHLSASFSVWESWWMEKSTLEAHQSMHLCKCRLFCGHWQIKSNAVGF